MWSAPREPAAQFSGTAEIRRRFLTTVIVATTCWGAGIVAATFLGLLPFQGLQAFNNLAFLVLNIVLLAVLRRLPDRAAGIAALYLAACYYLMICALFQVPQDQLRMLLFFPALGAVFLLLGSQAGWSAVAVSMVAFGTALAMGYLDVTPLATSTFVLSLSLTALFFHAFRDEALRALHTIGRQNATLDAAARLDPLTGLLNLRAFRDAMDAVTVLPGPSTYAVAFVDVDHFKAINDRFGHADGDAVLAAVADALRATVRTQDALARIGGEEFAVLMAGVDAEAAISLCEELRSAVERMRVKVADDELAVTVSVGLAVSGDDHHSVDSLLRRADAAMYFAKGEGRNRIAVAASP